MSGAQPAEAAVHAPRWGRALAIYAAVLAMLVGLALAWIATRPAPSYEQGPGSIVVSATDYAFSPGAVTWRAGERVRLTLNNDSEANPGKAHEFMMGRSPVMGETAFGSRPTGGFETDFFDGVRVKIVRARGLSMVMPGTAMMSQREIDRFVMGGTGAMQGMQMGGGQQAGAMPGMQMGGGQQAGAMPGMQAGGENGFMLMLEPGGSATISFVVPRKPGSWEFACFQQTGQHYTNGMQGQATVEPA